MPKENPSCEAQKQHVTMSKFAYNIIRNDSLTFSGKHNDSGFINHLIWSFKNDHFKFDEYPIDKETYEKIDLKIRLNSTNNKSPYNFLYTSEVWKKSSGIEFKRQSEFIRVLIENYAHSTFFRREQIYYWEKYKLLSNIIKRNELVEITTTSGNYTVKPYRFSNLYESAYNYIICFSKSGDSTIYLPASIRLSRIKDINPISNEELSSEEKATLESAIQSRGVEFLLGETKHIEVLLTPKGKSMYDSIFHQRPMYYDKPIIKPDGNILLKFNCTELQAKNYFLRLGAEAIIQSPDSLKKELLEIYARAISVYQQDFQYSVNN